ncbi:cell wall hydrolase [Sphingomonas cavernae]|uniref:Cell wall hydrolase n=1 Tax=Sphingomonas cavernae TaxID=2320861 RepID=A0A418WQD3_9SPHN|nr:cell wall hydrolase [Sphingomonas cavernae]RJF93454.1 cell wall hydrolase [Sphingomonas cavernae]
MMPTHTAKPGLRATTRSAAIAGMVALAVAGSAAGLGWEQLAALTGFAGEPAAAADIAPVSRAEQKALVELTRGPQAAIMVEGQDALLANAALPFSQTPIIAARPFSIAGAGVSDKERALQCMTQAVYYEAGFEPVEGKRAVAQVVLNRMRHPAFPKSVCGVVYEGSNQRVCQFSFTCDGSLMRAPAPAAWAEARKVATEALSGAVQSAVGLATHYHADYVSPYWAPRLTKLAQLGAHIFYRWPGGWGAPGAFGGRYAGLEAIPAFRTDALADATPVDPAEALGLPAERRAENDVGGRLDISKGWALKIPSPTESKGSFASITSQQAGATPAPTTLAANDKNIGS